MLKMLHFNKKDSNCYLLGYFITINYVDSNLSREYTN